MKTPALISVDTPYAIAAAIRGARVRKKMSRRELSEKSGISFNSIQSLETGVANPTMETLLSIVGVLGLNFALIDSGDGAMPGDAPPERSDLDAHLLSLNRFDA